MTKILSLFLLSVTVFAQNGPKPFTLQEAIDYALINNIASQDASNDVRLAELQKWQTTSTGLPQISANIAYNNWIQQQVSLVPAEFFGGAPGEFAEIAFGTQQAVNGTLTLNQKLFDGSYLVGLQAARVYLDISKLAREKTTTELRKAVTAAYGNILLIEANISILTKNITNVDKNIIELQKVYDNGMTEIENIEQLQLTHAGLISAKNFNLNLKSLAYQMFKLSLGLNIDDDVILTESLEDLVANSILQSSVTNGAKIDHIVDFKIALNEVRSKELLLKLERSKALPTLTAFVNGSYIGNNETFAFLEQSQKWFGASQFGVNMAIPIFSSLGRSASTKKAKINLEKSQRALSNVRRELDIEIKRATNDLSFAKQDLSIKKQALALAERIEEKNQIKFAEGIATSFELSQAQAQLYTAQQQYIQAMLGVLNKHITLDVLLNPDPKY